MGKLRLASGPPRIYEIPMGDGSDPRSSNSQYEDVVLAIHPTSQLLAVVKSTEVTLWMHSFTHITGASSEPADSILDTLSDEKGYDAHYLFSFPRELRGNTPTPPKKRTKPHATVWAYWISSLQLIISECGATNWELYEFNVDHAKSNSKPFSARLTTHSVAKILGNDDISSYNFSSSPQNEDTFAFLTLVTTDSIPILSVHQGQDETRPGYISSMAVLHSHVFLGLSDGFLAVIHVPSHSAPRTTTSGDWKIDLKPHFDSESASNSQASCHALSGGSISFDTVFLVACSSSQCVLLELNIPLKQIENSVSIPEPPTTCKLVSCALFVQQTTLLALGWSNSKTSLIHIEKATHSASISLHSVGELSLESDGYRASQLGSVVSIAWASDGAAVAVAYEKRGFSLFSTDGKRIMSSFPHQYQPVSHDNETCIHGAFQVAWTLQDSLLLVTPRPHHAVRAYEPEELYMEIQTELYKDEDGFCMSLSGALGRCGAWVRSFSPRPSNREAGSAEMNGKIDSGDLILSLDDGKDPMDLVNVPFHEIITRLKSVPTHTNVSIRFLRIQWEAIFTLLTIAIDNETFCNRNLIQILKEDPDLHARLVGLRMQNRHGDYTTRWDAELGQQSLSSDGISRYVDAWKSLKGTSATLSRQKYVKFIFSVFPTWNPVEILTEIAEFSKRINHARSSILMEYSIMQQVPMSGIASCLLFLQASSVYVVASRALETPWQLSTGARYTVPPTYAHALPLRLASFSSDTHQLAVAGQRGFCILNLLTGKWRGFGNVAQELDRYVTALLWLTNDVIAVGLTKASEHHERVHIEAYPRDHLDVEARVASISLTSSLPAIANVAKKDVCIIAMQVCGSFLYCFGSRSVWQIRMAMDAKIDRFVVCENRHFPYTLARKLAQDVEAFGTISTFTLLPRLVDLVHSDEKNESNEGSWISSVFQSLIHGQAPDQYANQDVFPRFLFHDSMQQDVLLWDPEARWMYTVARNVTRMVFFHLSLEECPLWPPMLQMFVGIHGTCGLSIWFPLLDGVFPSPSASFTNDVHSLRLFLLCQDPLRSKTHELEFGTAWPTWELYQQVLCEYGIQLDGNANTSCQAVSIASPKSISNDSTVALQMTMLHANVTIDSDTNVLGMEPSFGVLVAISQDIFSMVASDASITSVYDAFVRVQPILHVAIEVSVRWNQWKWAEQMLQTLWEEFPYASTATEMLLWNVVEGFHVGIYSETEWKRVISLVRPREWDTENTMKRDFALGIDEYCEIIAQLARKCEPSRRKSIFRFAGDPCDLISICKARKQLKTAANFLILLDTSESLGSEEAENTEMMRIVVFRNNSAVELVEMCLNEKEWKLAEEIVRVVRRWQIVYSHEKSDGRECIDEKLAEMASGDLETRNFERLAWMCDHLQAKLPPNGREKAESDLDEEMMEWLSNELHQRFIVSHRALELRSQSASDVEMGMKTKLMESLKASDVQVTDVSGGCGSMYNIKVVSSQFEGKSRVIQHRMVNEVLKNEIKGMHGLTIRTETPAK